MRDHLRRLAAHALDRLPAAAPLVGSRFEPVPEDEPLAVESVPAESVALDLPSLLPPAPAVAPSRPPLIAPEDGPFLTAPKDTRHTPGATHGAGDPADGAPSGARHRPPDAAQTQRDGTDRAPPAAGAATTNGTAPVADREDTANVPNSRSDEEEAAYAEPVRPARRLAAAAGTQAERSGESAPAPAPPPTAGRGVRRSPAEETATVRAAPVVGDDSDALLPPVVSELRSPSVGRLRPEPAAPEPTIHVTIGRVEVRATPPVAPAPAAAKAPAVMGLDDYLRRRGGGGSS